jgi:hypothetical protein
LLAITEPATETKRPELPLKSRPINKIRLLLGTSSNADPFFYEQGKLKPFSLFDLAGAKVLAYVTWDLTYSWEGQTQNRKFLQAGSPWYNLTLLSLMEQ